MIEAWVQMNPEGVDREIESAIWRNQVEERFFIFYTLNEMSPELRKKLSITDYYKINSTNFDLGSFKSEILQKQKLLHQSFKINGIMPEKIEPCEEAPKPEPTFALMGSTKKVKGTLLWREMALAAGANQFGFQPFVLFIIVARVSIPFIAHVLDGENPFDLNTDGIVFTALYSFITFFLSFANFIFIFFALLDF